MKMTPVPNCPDCGAKLQLVEDGQVGVSYAPAFNTGRKAEMRMEHRPFMACTGCELCMEIDWTMAAAVKAARSDVAVA